MEYPKFHRDIVNELMDGKFLLSTKEEWFTSLKENQDFYTSFFKESFNYQLKFTQDYGYLISNETNETFSRDVSIFFALFCYELDRDGKNFLDEIKHHEFEVETVENYFANSSYIDLIQSNKQLQTKDTRRNFINAMARRNIIEKITEERFTFTSAYKVFIDFATELANRPDPQQATIEASDEPGAE